MKLAFRDKKTHGLVALAAALMFAAPAFADVRIGVVNMSRLMDEAPQARSAVESLQDEFAPRQRDLVQRQEELQQRQERLQRDGSVMSDDERRSLERSVRDGQRDLERRQNEFVEDLNLRRNEVLGSLQRSLLGEIQEYARELGFDLVIGDGVLYASSAVNITPQILEKLERNAGR